MYTQAYILRCLSPLHAGSGDNNHGVIDNQVQRDQQTGYPIINSSSLKGALREHFDQLVREQKVSQSLVNDIFGAPINKGKDQANLTSAGKVTFDQSFLLSMPVRSDVVPSISVTTPHILHSLVERLDLFDAPKAEEVKKLLALFIGMIEQQGPIVPLVVNDRLQQGAILEELDFKTELLSYPKATEVEKLVGEPFALMRHTEYQQITQDLPVIARNELINGVSNNLWYEEIVPRESRFFTIISGPKELVDQFDALISKQVVQAGANASIGYGRLLFLPVTSLIS